MKVIDLFAVMSALLFSVGCAQLENDLVETEKTQGSWIGILEGADVSTKTSLGDPVDNIYPVLWSAGDEIKIFTAGHRVNDGVGTKMTLKSGAGEVMGIFEGDVPVLPEGCKLYYALYPYNASFSIGDAEHEFTDADNSWKYAPGERVEDNYYYSNFVVLSMPSVQKYAKSSFAKDYNPSLAVTTEAASETTELRFRNICGLLQINLTGNIKVGKITLTENGGNGIWGTVLARYRMRTSEPFDSEFVSYMVNEHGDNPAKTPKNLLTLDCGDGVQLTDAPTDFYFAIPVETTPGVTYFDGYQGYIWGLEETLTEGFTIRVYDVDGNEVYTKVTDVDNRIVRSKIRKMPVVDIRRNILTDLSANGTANSYIVKPNTSAKFYAGYRGCTTYPVGDIFKADVMWETTMSTGAPVARGSVLESAVYDPSTGYISLQTGAQNGNALVIVKDYADNILWSWHIWVTGYDPDSEGAVDSYNGQEFMNRNLGALDKYSENSTQPGNAGLRYQWGRKDPLDDAEDLRYTYFPSSPFTADYERDVEASSFKDYMTAHPATRFSKAVNSYPAIEWNDDKNANDPCPPGWQVVDMDALFGIVDFLSGSGDEWAGHMFFHGDYFSINDFSPAATYPNLRHWVNENSYYYDTHTYGNADGWCAWGYNNEGDRLPVRCQRSSTVKKIEYVDLSADGTANSYMVKPNGHYKFNAMVKGNSNESVGMGARVGYIYMTENRNDVKTNGWSHGHIGGTCDKTVIRDVFYKDGYIYFSTSLDKTYGNAVISVQDIYHTNLWSWHIWSVDYDPELSFDQVVWGKGGRKMMKMNLGALTNTKKTSQSLGLVYQWGRKDPYVSPIAYDTPQESVYIGLHNKVDFDSETATEVFAMQNPHLALMASEDGDWLEQTNNTLWGEVKTLYDPCPPGWMVPSRPDWDGVDIVAGLYEFGGLTMDGVWFPATGYRHHLSFNFNNVGTQGHYWYSTPKDNGSAYVFYFDDDKIDLANHADNKAQCNPVRCVEDATYNIQ